MFLKIKWRGAVDQMRTSPELKLIILQMPMPYQLYAKVA